MTTRDDDPTVLALRSLDAADPVLSPAQRARAAAELEQIMTADRGAVGGSSAVDDESRRRPRRLLLAGGLTAAAVAVVVAVPVLSGSDEAFASWTPTPVELRGQQRAAALDACLVLQGGGAVEPAPAREAEASVLVAEARGGWSYVVFRAVDAAGRGLQGSCLVPDTLVADPRPGEGGFFGSLDPAEDVAGPVRGPSVVRVDSFGAGSVEGDTFVHVEGRAGADVVGIEVTTPGGSEVEASVSRGRWAAWWPADDTDGVPDGGEAPTYRVTLRDGTVTDEVRTAG